MEAWEKVLREPELVELLRLRRWTGAQKEAVRAMQRRSGLPVREFCRRVGIAVTRLYRSSRGEGEASSNATPSAGANAESQLPAPFAPLRLVRELESRAPEPCPAEPACAEFVSVRGERIRLWPHAPESWVRALWQGLVPPC